MPLFFICPLIDHELYVNFMRNKSFLLTPSQIIIYMLFLNAGDVPHLSEVRIVLLGYRNAGKSSSGNTILGREEFVTVGRTAQCVKRQGQVAGRQVTVVEAPGWWVNHQLEQTPELTDRQTDRQTAH